MVFGRTTKIYLEVTIKKKARKNTGFPLQKDVGKQIPEGNGNKGPRHRRKIGSGTEESCRTLTWKCLEGKATCQLEGGNLKSPKAVPKPSRHRWFSVGGSGSVARGAGQWCSFITRTWCRCMHGMYRTLDAELEVQ